MIKAWRRMERHSDEKFWKSPWAVKWGWTFPFIMQEITELAQVGFVYWKSGSLKYRCIFCLVSDCSWMRVWGFSVLGSILGAHYPWEKSKKAQASLAPKMLLSTSKVSADKNWNQIQAGACNQQCPSKCITAWRSKEHERFLLIICLISTPEEQGLLGSGRRKT